MDVMEYNQTYIHKTCLKACNSYIPEYSKSIPCHHLYHSRTPLCCYYYVALSPLLHFVIYSNVQQYSHHGKKLSTYIVIQYGSLQPQFQHLAMLWCLTLHCIPEFKIPLRTEIVKKLAYIHPFYRFLISGNFYICFSWLQ